MFEIKRAIAGRLLSVWLVAAGMLSSCSSLSAPLSYNYHRRLWEKAIVDAEAAVRQGNQTAADSFYKVALTESELFGQTDIRYAITLAEMGGLYRLEGKDEDSLSAYEKARAIVTAILKSVSPGSIRLLDGQELANILTELAGIYLARNDDNQAMACCKEAIGIYEDDWREAKDKILGQHFAKALFEQALLLQKAGDLAASKDYFERALAMHTWSGGSGSGELAMRRGHDVVLAALAATNGQSGPEAAEGAQVRDEKSSTHDFWFQYLKDGDECAKHGNLSEAERMYEHSLSKAESVATEWDGIVQTLHRLEDVCAKQNAYARVEAYKKKEIALLEKLRGPRDLSLVMPLYELGLLMGSERTNYDLKAVPILERAAAIASEKGDSLAHDVACKALQLATTCYTTHHDYQSAERVALKTYRLGEKVYTSEQQWLTVFPLLTLVEIYSTTKQSEKELSAISQIDKLTQAPGVYRNLKVASCLIRLANVCLGDGHEKYARVLLERANEITSDAIAKTRVLPERESGGIGKQDPEAAGSLALAYYYLACNFHQKGNASEAEANFRRCLDWCSQTGTTADWIAAYSLETVADIYRSRKRDREAIDMIKRAIGLRQKIIIAGKTNGMGASGVAEHQAILDKDVSFLRELLARKGK